MNGIRATYSVNTSTKTSILGDIFEFCSKALLAIKVDVDLRSAVLVVIQTVRLEQSQRAIWSIFDRKTIFIIKYMINIWKTGLMSDHKTPIKVLRDFFSNSKSVILRYVVSCLN